MRLADCSRAWPGRLSFEAPDLAFLPLAGRTGGSRETAGLCAWGRHVQGLAGPGIGAAMAGPTAGTLDACTVRVLCARLGCRHRAHGRTLPLCTWRADC